jgi:hypothetical protein
MPTSSSSIAENEDEDDPPDDDGADAFLLLRLYHQHLWYVQSQWLLISRNDILEPCDHTGTWHFKLENWEANHLLPAVFSACLAPAGVPSLRVTLQLSFLRQYLLRLHFVCIEVHAPLDGEPLCLFASMMLISPNTSRFSLPPHQVCYRIYEEDGTHVVLFSFDLHSFVYRTYIE